MKKALWAAGLLLVAGTATGCGDDGGGGGGGAGGAPEDASVEDFCKPFTDAENDEDAKVADVADDLKDVGTPKDIPDDARQGFEFLIENAEDLDKNSEDLDDEQAFKDKYGDDEFKQIEAFITYLATTCAPELPDAPTSGLPTEDLGDLPTDELPTDELPTGRAHSPRAQLIGRSQTTCGGDPVSLTIGRPASAQSTMPPPRFTAGRPC